VPPLLPVVRPTSSEESFIGDAANVGKYRRVALRRYTQRL
jgi:hypothetical protein